MKFIDYLVYFVKLFDIKNVYIRYVVNDFIDGNVLDFLMFVEVCFDDGGLCIVNIFIFNNVFVLKFQKIWDKFFLIKGIINVICYIEFSYL